MGWLGEKWEGWRERRKAQAAEAGAEKITLTKGEFAEMIKSAKPQDFVKHRGLAASTGEMFVTANSDVTRTNKATLEASVYAYRCATMIALAVSSVPVKAVRSTAGSTVQLPEQHPLSKLLKEPNEEWSWEDYAQSAVYGLLLGGQTFTTKIRSVLDGDSALYEDRGVPSEIWAYGPRDFIPEPGMPGEPFVVNYKSTTNRAIDVAPEDMIDIKYVHPTKRYRGLGPMGPAAEAVTTDAKAKRWNDAVLDNLGVPSGIIQLHCDMDEEQFRRTLKNFRDEWLGARNARRPMVLGNEVTWLDLAKTAVEADFLGGRKLTREEICTAFGVPPILVGILDRATYSNFDTSMFAFWTLAVQPVLRILAGKLTRGLAKEFGEDLLIEFDLSGIWALLPQAKQKLDNAQVLAELGVPLSSVNALLDLGIPAFPGWDISQKSLEKAKALAELGVPFSTINDRLGLGIAEFAGWDVSLRSSKLVPHSSAEASPEAPFTQTGKISIARLSSLAAHDDDAALALEITRELRARSPTFAEDAPEIPNERVARYVLGAMMRSTPMH